VVNRQSHPRSPQVHACPFPNACTWTRGREAPQLPSESPLERSDYLLALQMKYMGYKSKELPADLVENYTLGQCAMGYVTEVSMSIVPMY
jgi:hypothetical protein